MPWRVSMAATRCGAFICICLIHAPTPVCIFMCRPRRGPVPARVKIRRLAAGLAGILEWRAPRSEINPTKQARGLLPNGAGVFGWLSPAPAGPPPPPPPREGPLPPLAWPRAAMRVGFHPAATANSNTTTRDSNLIKSQIASWLGAQGPPWR